MISVSFMLLVCEDAKVMSYSDNVGEEIKIKGRRLQDIFYTKKVEMFRGTQERKYVNFKKGNKKIERLKDNQSTLVISD